MRSVNVMNKKLLLLPISLLLLSSCSKRDRYPKFEYRINSAYQTILEEYYEIHKDEYIAEYYDDVEMREHIRKIKNDKNWEPSSKDMQIAYSYGEFNGTYVFIPYFLNCVINSKITMNYKMLDRYTFHCGFQSNELPLVFFNNHHFYDVNEAYENNIISDDDLLTISSFSYILAPDEYYSYSNLLAYAKSTNLSMDSYEFEHYNWNSYHSLLKFKEHLKEESKEEIVEKTEWAYYFKHFDLKGNMYSLCLFNNDELNLKSGYDYQYTETFNENEISFNSNYGATVIIYHVENEIYEFISIKEAYERSIYNDESLITLDKLFRFDKKGLVGCWAVVSISDYLY